MSDRYARRIERSLYLDGPTEQSDGQPDGGGDHADEAKPDEVGERVGVAVDRVAARVARRPRDAADRPAHAVDRGGESGGAETILGVVFALEIGVSGDVIGLSFVPVSLNRQENGRGRWPLSWGV